MTASLAGNRVPLSVIILTFQEEDNLGACLDNVCGWAHQVYVVDSFSTDRTVDIAEQKGVAVYKHAFTNMAHQRNWALRTLPLDLPWVLFLDADERLTPELKAELADILPRIPEEISGLYTRRRFFWMGRWLKHGGMYKWILRTVRHDRARVEMAGRREYMRVEGQTLHLKNDFLHDDSKGVSDWIIKHDKYALQEANELLAGSIQHTSDKNRHPSPHSIASETESANIIKLRRYWNRLPLFCRSPLNFLIKYIFMLGFLDGIPGLTYYVLHDFWYPFLVDVKVLELRKVSSKG